MSKAWLVFTLNRLLLSFNITVSFNLCFGKQFRSNEVGKKHIYPSISKQQHKYWRIWKTINYVLESWALMFLSCCAINVLFIELLHAGCLTWRTNIVHMTKLPYPGLYKKYNRILLSRLFACIVSHGTPTII